MPGRCRIGHSAIGCNHHFHHDRQTFQTPPKKEICHKFLGSLGKILSTVLEEVVLVHGWPSDGECPFLQRVDITDSDRGYLPHHTPRFQHRELTSRGNRLIDATPSRSASATVPTGHRGAGGRCVSAGRRVKIGRSPAAEHPLVRDAWSRLSFCVSCRHGPFGRDVATFASLGQILRVRRPAFTSATSPGATAHIAPSKRCTKERAGTARRGLLSCALCTESCDAARVRSPGSQASAML